MKICSLLPFLTIVFIVSCQPHYEDPTIASFKVFCEMVGSEAKPLALSYPMDPEYANDNLEQFESIAAKYGVQIYKEDSLPTTWLFPESSTKDKSIIIAFKGARLTQYRQLKTDWANTSKEDTIAQIKLARRFGRLLGYSPQGINKLLSNNTYYTTLSSFDVNQQVTHLYFDDLAHANRFYGNTLELNRIDSGTYQICEDAFIRLHPTSEKHPSGQPKSTAIALLTDQLSEWYEYVQTQNVPIKYTYKPRYNPAHDGFVAIDPGGYLLEFEMFKQHPENELFMAKLENSPRIETSIDSLFFYGSITWTYHKDLLKMQNFYEQQLGFQLVADQGWTKIYQTSKTGFIGLVDERRGMEDYADGKAVEIEWELNNSGFSDYSNKYWNNYDAKSSSFMGPENYIYKIAN